MSMGAIFGSGGGQGGSGTSFSAYCSQCDSSHCFHIQMGGVNDPRLRQIHDDLRRRELMGAQNAAMGLTPYESVAAKKPDNRNKILLLRRGK